MKNENLTAQEQELTNLEPDDLELRVLYFIATSVLPVIEEDWAVHGVDGRVLGTAFYSALGTLIVNAVERKESLDRVLRTIGAIVEYAAVALDKDWIHWASYLHEFFESLEQSPAANSLFAQFASERIRAGAARIGYTWAPEG